MMTTENKLTVTLRDLIAANAEVYARREAPEMAQMALPEMEVVAYSFDPKSHHGGIAYYHQDSGTLVMAHRGSATAKDWLVTDRQILFGKDETKADTEALAFSDKVLAELQATGRPVTSIIETGHSKGGRESQMVLAKLLQQGQVPVVGLTLNSARVDKDVRKGLDDIPHVNFRIDGGSFLSTDWVSSYGKQLGIQVDFPNQDINFFVSAHRLEAFAEGIKKYPGLAVLDVRKVVQLCQQGMSVIEMNQYGLKSLETKNQLLASAKDGAYLLPEQKMRSMFIDEHADVSAKRLDEAALLDTMCKHHHQISVQIEILVKEIEQHPLLQSHLSALHQYMVSVDSETFHFAQKNIQTVVSSHVAIQDQLIRINDHTQTLTDLQQKMLNHADSKAVLANVAQDIIQVRRALTGIGVSSSIKASMPLAANPRFGEAVLQRLQRLQQNNSQSSNQSYSPS